MKKYNKLIIFTIIIVAVIVAFTVSMKIFLPYAVVIDGRTAFVVDNRADGEAAIRKIAADYVPEGSEFKNVSLDNNVSFRQLNPIEAFKTDKQMTEEEVVEYVQKANESGSPVMNIIINSDIVKEENYRPEPKYIKEEDQLAGTKEVEVKGKDGRKKTTYRITSVNGKEESRAQIDEEILEEGVQAVIHKGTLGVPEGEDWKTYEGDPVLSSGEDIKTSAMQHFGSPYKYGGSSFVTGIDCVQYIRNIYKMYGITLPNNHSGLKRVGSGVSLKNAKPGDIVCYRNHVGIYIGNGKMADATRKKGTGVSKIKTGKLVTIRRVKH